MSYLLPLSQLYSSSRLEISLDFILHQHPLFTGPNVSLLSLRTLNFGFVLNIETVRFLGPTEFSLGGDSKKDVLQTFDIDMTLENHASASWPSLSGLVTTSVRNIEIRPQKGLKRNMVT